MRVGKYISIGAPTGLQKKKPGAILLPPAAPGQQMLSSWNLK
jgi:hypothetical protein